MLKRLVQFVRWTWIAWKGLPDETKVKVIGVFTDHVEELLRRYYRERKTT